MSRRLCVALALAALIVVLPAHAQASSPTGGTTYTSTGSPHGGTAAQAQASPEAPVPTATTPPPPTAVATVGPDGLAVAPAGAPAQVAAIVAAGNAIAKLPYKYGGGHGDFDDAAYDCSGSVSYALHGAQLLDTTLDSTGLSRWGVAGAGQWVTVYANKTHTYLVVAGLRFDTSGQKAAGTRWQAAARSSRGFKIRHPSGL